MQSADGRTSHPELYTAPHKNAAEDEVAEFLASLVYLLKPDYVLETGAAFGHTSEKIALALRRNGVGHLHTMEPNSNRFFPAQERLQAHGGLPLTLLKCKYQDFEPPQGTSYRLCFFDATRHTRDEEYKYFRPWIDPLAILVFHDCGEQHPGMEGVERLEAEGLIKSLYMPCPRGICVATPT